jgi:hypothetical protein
VRANVPACAREFIATAKLTQSTFKKKF